MTATDYVHYTCDHEAGMCDAELVIKTTEHEFDMGVTFGQSGWTCRTSLGWEPAHLKAGYLYVGGGLIVQHFCPDHSGGKS